MRKLGDERSQNGRKKIEIVSEIKGENHSAAFIVPRATREIIIEFFGIKRNPRFSIFYSTCRNELFSGANNRAFSAYLFTFAHRKNHNGIPFTRACTRRQNENRTMKIINQNEKKSEFQRRFFAYLQ